MARKSLIGIPEDDPMHPARVGERIRARRQQLRMRIVDLANALGTTASAAQQWETGETALSVVRLAEIAHELRINRRWLVLGEPDSLSGEELKLLVQTTVDRIAANRTASGRRIPLTTLEQFEHYLSNWGGNTPELPSLKTTETYVPSCDVSDRALAFRITARDAGPELEPGDFAVTDPAVDARPDDLIVVKTISAPARLRRFSLSGGGGVRLTALNPSWGHEEFPEGKFKPLWVAPVLQWTKQRRA